MSALVHQIRAAYGRDDGRWAGWSSRVVGDKIELKYHSSIQEASQEPNPHPRGRIWNQ